MTQGRFLASMVVAAAVAILAAQVVTNCHWFGLGIPNAARASAFVVLFLLVWLLAALAFARKGVR